MIRSLTFLSAAFCVWLSVPTTASAAEGPFSKIGRTANDAHTPVIDAPDSVKRSP